MRTLKFILPVVISLMFGVSSAAFAEEIVIKGSTTVLPIAQKCVEAYMKKNPDVKISLSGGGSSNGIKALMEGSTDIATSSRYMKAKENQGSCEKGVFPVPFSVAYDSIIPVVHPSNPVTNITIDQLKAIYMGKIRNWKEVGGEDKQIVVNSRDTSSGTYESWEEIVMKKERVVPSAQVMASNGAIVQAVSKNKFAIGYIGIGYLNADVKPLSVNGVTGSEETTLDHTYPISRPLFMFTNGWPKGEVLNFINFVLHPKKGQELVAESGYVRLY